MLKSVGGFWINFGYVPVFVSVLLSNISAIQNGLDKGVAYCSRGNIGTIIRVEKGDTGYIASVGFPSNYSTDNYQGRLCNVEMQACSTCKIRLKFVLLQFPNCTQNRPTGGNHIMSVCISGCDHLRLFEADQPYHRTTQRYYFSDAEGEMYESISSRIVIQHCMSNASFADGKKFYLKYEVIDKIERITATVSPPLYSVISGHITSPNFPHGYATNGETFTYMLQNLDPYGHVTLVFEDWDIAECSQILVYEEMSGPTKPKVYGHRDRPTIMSIANTLVLVFNVGTDPTACCSHLGFKAQYSFVSDDKWKNRPRTDCSESYLLQSGGEITFAGKSRNIPQWFDCVWTIKRYIANYPDGVFIRVHEVNLGEGWYQDSLNSIDVHQGTTSEGSLLAHYTSQNLTDGLTLYSPGDGLYIRMRGVFNQMDRLNIVFTGVNNLTADGCPRSADFMCENMWCIHGDLTCDGVDHCGDNSDESPIFVCIEDDSHWSWQGQTEDTNDIETTTEESCYGRFRCHDDSACIHPNQLCDSIVNCKDHSDESSCSFQFFNAVPSVHSSNSLVYLMFILILTKIHPSIT